MNRKFLYKMIVPTSETEEYVKSEVFLQDREDGDYQIIFRSSDNQSKIFGKIWIPEGEPIGMIQFVHGITEHMKRYEESAEYFRERGYIVCGIDLVGHGQSLYYGLRGCMGSWESMTQDVFRCYQKMKSKYPELPFYMVGFSLGSFIARTLILRKGKELQLNGCFLIGTGSQPVGILRMVKAILICQTELKGRFYSGRLVHFLAFDNYNKKIGSAKSYADWLLEDKEALKQYLNDELCFEEVSTGMFLELINGMLFCCNPKKK